MKETKEALALKECNRCIDVIFESIKEKNVSKLALSLESFSTYYNSFFKNASYFDIGEFQHYLEEHIDYKFKGLCK